MVCSRSAVVRIGNHGGIFFVDPSWIARAQGASALTSPGIGPFGRLDGSSGNVVQNRASL
jgi:hypothetical protein